MAVALDAGLLHHLETLDTEVAELNKELKQARQAWSASGDALKKEVYDAVKEELAQLNQTRQDLHSKLAGVWGAVNIVQALVTGVLSIRCAVGPACYDRPADRANECSKWRNGFETCVYRATALIVSVHSCTCIRAFAQTLLAR
jgi:hypothetical protein